jgi:hypothetical protein
LPGKESSDSATNIHGRQVSAQPTPQGDNVPAYTPTQIAQLRDSSVSVQAGGVATAPTAGTAIATATITTPGLYEVTVTYALGAGTPVIGDVGNMNVKQNTVAKTVLPVPISGNNAPVTLLLQCAVNDTVSVTAVANATSGVGYTAAIVARLLAPA